MVKPMDNTMAAVPKKTNITPVKKSLGCRMRIVGSVKQTPLSLFSKEG